MRLLLLVFVLLLIPQLAMARVFMCVDPATGHTSFSDKGCQTTGPQEEVRVQATNVDSGSRTAQAASEKTWVSDRDTRKTGLDYSAERRSFGHNKTTASVSALTDSDDS